MSWGERSCQYLRRVCPNPKQSLSTCNVDCLHYESNGMEPDSVSSNHKRINQGRVTLPQLTKNQRKKQRQLRRKK